jgi:hypothetical protein
MEHLRLTSILYGLNRMFLDKKINNDFLNHIEHLNPYERGALRWLCNRQDFLKKRVFNTIAPQGFLYKVVSKCLNYDTVDFDLYEGIVFFVRGKTPQHVTKVKINPDTKFFGLHTKEPTLAFDLLKILEGSEVETPFRLSSQRSFEDKGRQTFIKYNKYENLSKSKQRATPLCCYTLVPFPYLAAKNNSNIFGLSPSGLLQKDSDRIKVLLDTLHKEMIAIFRYVMKIRILKLKINPLTDLKLLPFLCDILHNPSYKLEGSNVIFDYGSSGGGFQSCSD